MTRRGMSAPEDAAVKHAKAGRPVVRMYEITVGGCTRRHGRSSGDTVSEHPTFPQTRIPERRAACTPDLVGRNGRARVMLTPDPHTSSATCRRSSLRSNAPTGSVTHAVPLVPIAKSASSPHGDLVAGGCETRPRQPFTRPSLA